MRLAMYAAPSLRPDLYRTSRTDLWHACEHEAIHAATFAALGWTLLGASVDDHPTDGWGGHVEYAAPADRTEDQRLREHLVATVAPRALDACASGGDSRDGWKLAETIAATAEFERVKHEVRLALGDKHRLSGRELASIVLNRPLTANRGASGSGCSSSAGQAGGARRELRCQPVARLAPADRGRNDRPRPHRSRTAHPAS